MILWNLRTALTFDILIFINFYNVLGVLEKRGFCLENWWVQEAFSFWERLKNGPKSLFYEGGSFQEVYGRVRDYK